jgi:hypothetical protein
MAGPRIGRKFQEQPASSKLSSATEDLLHIPEAQEAGTISREKLRQIIDDVPPPPWETDKSYGRHDSDARKFIDAPDNVTLRWLNPKLVNQTTMRNWQAVPAKGDPRFKLKLKSLAAVDNTVRRGDSNGDFLAWMYTAWVESRNKIKAQANDRNVRKARDDQQRTSEAFRSGQFSPYITNDVEAKHPTRTLVDGRSLGSVDV